MSALIESWTDSPLGDLIEGIRAGKNFRCIERPPGPNEKGVIKISAVSWGRFDEGESKTVPPGVSLDERTRIQKGDLLISRANTVELVGASVLVGDITSALYLSDKVLRLEVGEELRPWLQKYLSSPAARKLLGAASSGNQLSMRNISQEALRSLVIPLAPPDERRRIAEKLDALLKRVDACRERLDRVPEILKRFRQSVLAAATSGRLTEEWRGRWGSESARIEVLRKLDQRRSRSITLGQRFKEPAPPDLRYWTQDVPDSWSVESVSSFSECLDHFRVPVKRCSRNAKVGLYPYYGANGEVDRVDEYIFDDELVLVTEDETFYGREKPIAYRASGKCWVNNHAHVLAAGEPFEADYLCYCLMYYSVLPWLTGTTGRAKLTQGVLNSLPMAVPPRCEMQEIVRRVKSAFQYIDAIAEQCRSAKARVTDLSPVLLTKAFSGELMEEQATQKGRMLARLRTETAEGSTGAHLGVEWTHSPVDGLNKIRMG